MELTKYGQQLEDATTLRRVARDLEDIAKRRNSPGLYTIIDSCRSSALRIERDGQINRHLFSSMVSS